MKNKVISGIILAVVLGCPAGLFSQGVGIGTTDPNISAGLQVSFPDKGLLIPQVDLGVQLTTTGVDAHGLMVYNTNTGVLLGSGLYVNRSSTAMPDWSRVSTNLLGSGFAGRVAFWGNTSTLSHSSDLFWDNLNGWLGIGTSLPGQQLTLTGNLQISASASASVGVIYKSTSRYIHDYGNYNEFFGYGAGNFTLTGPSNIGIGDDVLASLTSGHSNTAVGDYAMFATSSGSSNTAIGSNTMPANTTGSNNVAVGLNALNRNTLCDYNIAIGSDALQSQTTGAGNPNTFNLAIGTSALFSTNPTDNQNGRRNSAIGREALYNNTSGYDNTAIGYRALFSNTIAGLNIAIGTSALYSMVSGNGNNSTGNIAIGHEALYRTAPSTLSDGRQNVGIGYMALHENVTGTWNNAVGYFAAYYATGSDNTCLGGHAMYYSNIGTGNTAIGNHALYNNLTGSYNTALGDWAGVNAGNYENTVAIGYNTLATASNEVRIGNSSTASFYCMGIYNSTGAYFDVTVTGGGQLVRNTSSKRYKTDIHDLEVDTEKIYDLRPVSFTRTSDQERGFGLIAEEVAGVLPELAIYAPESQAVPGSESDRLVPESVRYSMLAVLLLKEVQKHQQRIAELEAQLAKNEALMREIMEKAGKNEFRR